MVLLDVIPSFPVKGYHALVLHDDGNHAIGIPLFFIEPIGFKCAPFSRDGVLCDDDVFHCAFVLICIAFALICLAMLHCPPSIVFHLLFDVPSEVDAH